jgi:hypothetical protein
MKKHLKFTLSIFFTCWLVNWVHSSHTHSKLLDGFSSLSGWQTISSDQVNIHAQIWEGFSGTCFKIDFDFTTGSGYGGIRKIFPLELPENFQFSFYIKGEAPTNNLEFKLLDSTGENVWWFNQRNFQFPSDWKKIIIKKRHISFAWGPTQDRTLHKVASIEFIVASSSGGKGSIYLDQLAFEPLESPDPNPPKPTCKVSSTIDSQHQWKSLFDADLNTSWRSKPQPENQYLLIDFLKYREFGGLIIDWDDLDYAQKYQLQVSNDQKEWISAYQVNSGKGGRSYIYLKDQDSRYLKIQFLKSNRGAGYAIREIEIQNVDFSQNKENFFTAIASEKPRGYFPRYLNQEQSYWTISGVNRDRDEALINEEGMVEVDKGCFSIEPFLFTGDSLITWNDVALKHTLEKEYLPIPQVEWLHPDFRLTIQVLAAGVADSSVLFIRYKFKNLSNSQFSGNLYLAIRPFQVNSPWQFLNNPGGLTRIETIQYDGDLQKVLVNRDKIIFLLSPADDFGAVEFDGGDITDYLAEDNLPIDQIINDHFGHASGALKFAINAAVAGSLDIFLGVPFHEKYHPLPVFSDNISVRNFYQRQFKDVSCFWEEKVNKVNFTVPPSAQPIVNSIRSNLAYILINQDGPGIQPGSRSYERSWIRDGSLTSSALLKMGIQSEVKEFIQWYSQYQATDGKVPCVVDQRGPDPVPENDSHGQLIFAIMQYFQFTNDTIFLRSQYPHIRLAVDYIESLMNQRLTDHYQNGNDSLQSLFGLLPESISHEGYSDKPRHSYWDDFFALRGLKDAVIAAGILGEKSDEKRYVELKELFERNLYRSLELTIQRTGIDYIPGCAELGDFDATSTTIAISPGNELSNLPQPYAQNTFDRYYAYFCKRSDPVFEWKDYTPYEIRLIGSFIFLQQPPRAHQLLDFFFQDQRPSGWNQWAEVVRKGYRTPGFIGDLPHTWVGSDFINAARSMFVYEDEHAQSLVIGEGLHPSWLDSPERIEINNLPTYYGLLNYAIKKQDKIYYFEAWGKVSTPQGYFLLKNLWKDLQKSITVNGKICQDLPQNYIPFSEFPVRIEIQIY